MTDDRPDELEEAPALPAPADEPARLPTEPAVGTESPPPSGDPGAAPAAPPSPAPADTVLTTDSGDGSEPAAQSKFSRPSGSLGLRPSAEQTKADLSLAAGLGSVPRPVPPRRADTPPPSGPALPPARTAPIPAVPSAVPAFQPASPARPVPPTSTPAPTPAGVPIPAVAPGEDLEDDHVPTWGERLRTLSPALVTLSVGSIGALVFTIMAMTSHTTPVAVLLSAGVVVTLAFAADAVIASIATWRAAVWDEDPGRALLLAVLAGGSAVVCAGALGATTVLLMVLNGF